MSRRWDSADASGTFSRPDLPRVSPGKRARTDGLPMRKQAPAPASIPSAPVASAPDSAEDPFGVHLIARARDGVSGSGEPLPHADRVQASFGHHDIGHVRAHVGGQAADAAGALHAHAYAT